ncbi:unnamed protein product [Coregonus sp. 'balchen']|nr:unnamed protein product [Coregonus sp. 'balchen']
MGCEGGREEDGEREKRTGWRGWKEGGGNVGGCEREWVRGLEERDGREDGEESEKETGMERVEEMEGGMGESENGVERVEEREGGRGEREWDGEGGEEEGGRGGMGREGGERGWRGGREGGMGGERENGMERGEEREGGIREGWGERENGMERGEEREGWMGRELLCRTLPYDIKIVIAGNHELTFDQEFMADLIKQDFYYFPSATKLKPENYENVQSLLTNCIYLQDSEVTVRGFRIYGSPWWL